MADGSLEDTITDLDFLETLAARHCFLLPPFVMRANPSGKLAKVTHLVYTIDGKLDKPRILINTAKQLRHQRQLPPFGPRFSV